MTIFKARRGMTGLMALTITLAASQAAFAQARPGEHGAGPRGGFGGGAPAAPAAPSAPAAPAGGGAPHGGFGSGGFGGGAPAARPAPAMPSAPAAPAGSHGWSGGGMGGDRGADRGDWNRGDPNRGGWNRGNTPATTPAPQPNWNGGGRPSSPPVTTPAPAPQPNWGATQPGRHGTDGWRGQDNRGPDNRGPVVGGGSPPRNDSWRGNGGNGGWNGARNDGWRGNNGWRNDGWRGNSWNHDWRQDRRYDWQRLRNDNRMAFHVGRYYPPYRGHSYRRMSVGLYLDRLFYGPTYYITDYYNYRLPDPYGPYQWVRYWDDAVLVDIYTGEVVDVLYDFFW